MSNQPPAARWSQSARQPEPPAGWRLRLAAMAAHMRVDRTAARRAAIIDLLADGRPHPREEIYERVADQLGADCWGKRPREALARDLRVLRQGGLRIAFCRRPAITGYYLQHPPLAAAAGPTTEAINWELVAAIRRLTVPEKNARVFAAADFARRQRQLILAEEHPDWSQERVEREVRRLVFGVAPDPDDA